MFIAKKLIHSQNGMTLLELMLAITMLAVVTLGTSGFVTGTLRVSQMGQQKMNMQQDLNFSFRQVENQMMQSQNGKDLRYQISFTFGAVGDLTETVLIKDALADPVNPPNVCQLTINYSSAADGTNPLQVNSMGIQCPVTAVQQQFLVNGFKPWARLKDYDLNGVIDAADAAKRDTCLQNLTVSDCFDATACAASLAAGKFGFDDPTVVNVSQMCLDKSVFPFMEISKDRGLLYFSLQPWHLNTQTGINERRMVGFTKTVALHPVETL